MTSATNGRGVGHDLDPASRPDDELGGAAAAALSKKTLEQLYRSERPLLARSLRGRLRDPDDIADVLQDAFERLARARPCTALKVPAAYLRRIVRNLVIDRRKLAEHRLVVREATPTESDQPIVAPQQSLHIEANDLMTAYLAALGMLSPRAREVFLLHRVEELRYREIAQRLGITVATVEYHMARALAHFDKALSE